MGAWGDQAAEAQKRLEESLVDIQASPLGGLTGVSQPIVPAAITLEGDALRFSAVLDPKKLAQGLRDATGAGLPEIFR
jgi:hypothetical protein